MKPKTAKQINQEMGVFTEYWAQSGEPTMLERTIWECGKKAGIKEVVDWIESQRMAAKTLIQDVGYGVAISDEKLEAKLREWGIKEGQCLE